MAAACWHFTGYSLIGYDLKQDSLTKLHALDQTTPIQFYIINTTAEMNGLYITCFPLVMAEYERMTSSQINECLGSIVDTGMTVNH